MRVFLYFLVYIFVCLGLAIAVVPLLQSALFEPIGLEPESSLYRFGMLVLLLGFPVFLRIVGLNNWKAAGYTLARRDAWPALGKGLLVGIAIMATLAVALVLIDARHFAPPEGRWSAWHFSSVLVRGLMTGLIVGFIEETFFRGLMHTGMRRTLAFWPTAGITALLYASLHFVKPEPLRGSEFTSASALDSVAQGLSRITDFAPIADSFLTLVCLGLFLSMVRERSGSVIWAIGIHAGLVVVMKMTKYLTDVTYVNGEISPWISGYKHITGWLAVLLIGTFAAVYWYRTRPRAVTYGAAEPVKVSQDS